MSVWYSWWEHKHGSSLTIRWLYNPLWTFTAIKHLFVGAIHPFEDAVHSWPKWNKANSETTFTLSFLFLAATPGSIRKVSSPKFLTWPRCLLLLQSIMSYSILHYPDLHMHSNGYVHLIHVTDKYMLGPILRYGINQILLLTQSCLNT